MLSKLDKYGMNLFLLCGCVSGYTFNGIPYIGRQGQQRNVGLAADTVKTLYKPLYFSVVNVTANNWFTSTNLAVDLLQNQIKLLETMRRNKPDIPKEFATGKNKEVGLSLFGFSDRQTLVSYVLKKNKSVILLSTIHNDNKMDEATEKPEMILKYNAAKAAVDGVDQLFIITACKKEQSVGLLLISITV